MNPVERTEVSNSGEQCPCFPCLNGDANLCWSLNLEEDDTKMDTTESNFPPDVALRMLHIKSPKGPPSAENTYVPQYLSNDNNGIYFDGFYIPEPDIILEECDADMITPKETLPNAVPDPVTEYYSLTLFSSCSQQVCEATPPSDSSYPAN